MIDLTRLQALRAVATFGTVTAAAGALHCTPSAISQHLAKLERETKATLVEKDGRTLRLTEAGRVLVEHAGRVLAAVEEAEAALAAHRETVSGRLSVASFPTACRGLLPHALRALGRDHPRLEPTVQEADRAACFDGLLRGTVDVALIDEWLEIPVTYPAGVASVELGLDVGDLIVPADHRLAADDGPVSLEEARDERWIGSKPGTVCYEWLERMMPGVRSTILVNEFETQLTFVAEGLGVAFIPRLARTSLPAGVVARPIAPEAARRVSVAWRASAGGRPAIGATVAALRDAWQHRAIFPAPFAWNAGQAIIHVV
ncbi:LysR family transcriptional regulator [Dactylosporangium sucinum]|uniref:LysR family transcriptional regulator n=1 Tax=Dactylosporangium sucinum TaxID=1424081 RepID=A0A917TXP5_9ACTN|nr:LysR family transcriptional regulator [Dactylosporangium sucinum]GGM43364.1 LysR family transcriptional regulator [Dactylosporangium sucinum]